VRDTLFVITLIGNLKGGTGKSTVNFNIAVWLASYRRPPLLFDLDPQRTLTDVVELREEEAYRPVLSICHDMDKIAGDYPGEILIDVGTADLEAMNAAIRHAQRVLVPVTPSQADVWSTQRFMQIIRTQRAGSPMPQVLAFINRADANPMMRETEETAEALGMLAGLSCIGPRLTQRAAFRRSFSEGQAVFELEPNSKAALEIKTLADALYP
jgi:chromosome partitioning protein